MSYKSTYEHPSTIETMHGQLEWNHDGLRPFQQALDNLSNTILPSDPESVEARENAVYDTASKLHIPSRAVNRIAKPIIHRLTEGNQLSTSSTMFQGQSTNEPSFGSTMVGLVKDFPSAAADVFSNVTVGDFREVLGDPIESFTSFGKEVISGFRGSGSSQDDFGFDTVGNSRGK